MDIQRKLEAVTKNYRTLNPKIQERLKEIDVISKISFKTAMNSKIKEIENLVASIINSGEDEKRL